MTNRETIIKNYINGYNRFDVEQMVADFDEHIAFKNLHNGQVTMSLIGLLAFKQQAEDAKAWFSERTQTIIAIHHVGNSTEIEIAYKAIVAVDFPNGPQKGQTLSLSGKSVFEFDGDKIIRLTDMS
ncbi:MAG: nuclear transport factor 2 family protein [Sediminibacterium sp.]|nr:nuclear transport factor 2 family protein [Sediminibacterium sp.]